MCENCRRRFISQKVSEHADMGVDAFREGRFETLEEAAAQLVAYFDKLYRTMQTTSVTQSPFHEEGDDDDEHSRH